MNLAELYANLATDGGDALIASSVLDAQHWFCALADFDPRSGEPLPRALNRVLLEISSGTALRNGPPKDRLWRVCKHCGMALQVLYRTPNEEPFRVHESLHIRAVRELDVQSFVKLSMRPGLNIRQKLSDNPHLDAVRHTMTLDLPENQLLKACSEELERRLDEKERAVGLLPDESELLDKIRSWLHTEAAASISQWKNLPPNNTLLSHREYRRVWDAWRQLGRIDDETAVDVARIDKIKDGIRFWEDVANLKRIDGIGMAEVPLLFSLNALSVVPFGDAWQSGRIPFVFVESNERVSIKGEFLSLGTKLPAITGDAVLPAVSIDRTAKPVCIDLTSVLPMYSTDKESARCVQHFLAWQRWRSPNGNQVVDVGCFEADGVWEKTGIQTVTPIDAFIQSCNDREVLDVAFRKMIDFLRVTYFGSETFIWLAPDFLDEFTLGLSRRAINSTFAAAEPLPRSIAAVIAQVPYDTVRPDDSILVIDQLGGVVSATKVVASHDDELAETAPETHGIRWTRHPSVVLRDERSKLDFGVCIPTVDENGTWTFGHSENPIIPTDVLNKATEIFGHCSKRIFATSPQFPLVCGGSRAYSLQRKAGDITIWRDQLPALSIGNVIVDGMYGDFVLVDPKSKSIRPVRGQTVPIPVPNIFNLPKRKTAFPLHQGEGRQTLDYVAEIDFPSQQSSIACRLDLRYTYGADEPYSLDFIPCTESRSLPRRIHVRWKNADQQSFVVPSSYPSPSFPQPKSWQELRNYPRKEGDGYRDLVDWAQTALMSIDPVVAAQEIADRQRKRQQDFDQKLERYYENRKRGTIRSSILTDKHGGRYFFVASDCGDVFCHESGMRNPDDAILLYEGQEVWFSLGVDKRTGRNKGLDISLDDSLPSSLIKNRPNFDADVQPNARPISEFISENDDRIRKALHNVRFPMITLMQGARSLSAPDFPEQLRCVIQRACEILDECLAASNVTDAIKSEALQVVSYLHSFAPGTFRNWALDVARNSGYLGEEDKWRKIAFCLGDMSQTWQEDICAAIINRLHSTKETKNRRFVLGILGIAAWRSMHFLEKLSNESIRAILPAIKAELEAGLLPSGLKAGRYPFYALCFELLLALQRVDQRTMRRYAPSLCPGSKQGERFVDLIDRWTHCLQKNNRTLRFRVMVDASKKPADLCKTPDFLYALRSFLTGKDGANDISITSIEEGVESYDDKD